MDLITLHPMLVHFPIACLFIAVGMELVFLFKGNSFYRQTSLWLFNFGAVTSIVAVASGFVAAEVIGHDSAYHDFVHDHRNVMLIMTGLWSLIAILIYYKKKTRLPKLLPIITMVIVAGIMTYGSDLGGKLVYQYGVGVKKPDTYHDVTDEMYFCHEQDDCSGDHAHGR